MSAAAVVRELYANIERADLAAAVALLAEDVVVVQAASLPFGGEWRGPDGFAAMAAEIGAAWPDFRATRALSWGMGATG